MSDECPPCKCPAGIPAWVLTFADLMSLLMCFFVLLLSFSEMDVQKFKQIAGSVKNAFGVQRDIKAVEIPKGVNIVAKEFSPAPPKPTVINEVRQKTSNDTNQELLLVKRIDELEAQESDLTKKLGKTDDQEEQEEIQDKIQKIQQEIQQLKEQLNQVGEKIKQLQEKEIKEQAQQFATALKQQIEEDQIEIETNEESFLIRLKDKGVFPAGSARLSDDFIDVLDIIKEELAKVKGAIIVAGHTDNIPINTVTFHSNWDLSAARAVSVVNELLYDSDIDPNRISIQAFADSRPLVDNDTPEHRATNRRVEIIVSKSKTELNALDDEEQGHTDKNPVLDKPETSQQPQKPDLSSSIKKRFQSVKQTLNPSTTTPRTKQQNRATEKPENTILQTTKRPQPDINNSTKTAQINSNTEIQSESQTDELNDQQPPNFINF